MPTGKISYNIPERFLRQLWKNQQFAVSNLRSADNQPIEIISTGLSNRDGGPDFTNAAVRINGTLYRGDVEIHQRNQEWFEHKHHEDAKYNSVVLHVVLHIEPAIIPPVTESKRTIPVLALDRYFTSSYRSNWEKMILDERAERLTTIRCYSTNANVDSVIIKKWLEKLSVERIELKVRRFEERLKELAEEQHLQVKEPPSRYNEIPFGINPEDLPPPIPKYSPADFRKVHLWEQLLYEGIMEALGYSKNQQPFLKLSRNVRLKSLTNLISSPPRDENIYHVEALLFGVAGLLPSVRKHMDSESKQYLRLLRQYWKKYQTFYTNERLAASEWQFFRLRPENFPTVRLAGASRLIYKFQQKGFFKSIIQDLKKREQSNREKFILLEKLFVIQADGFWSAHFRFGELSKITLKTLIGDNRSNDIILNAIIPICLLYARLFKDKDVRQGTLKIFEQCSPLSDNTITRIIDQQIIKEKFQMRTAMLQQGALQLYKFYCAEGKCEECTIGRFIA